MNRLFNPDNPVMRFLGKLGNAIYLNLLWMICCIPIFTAGAATTALFHTCRRMIREQGTGLTGDFFSSFKTNFKQSTLVWLILLGIGAVLAADGYILFHLRFAHSFWTFLFAVLIVGTVVYFIVLMYIFPLMANFTNTIPAMFRNSLMIGMRFLLCTALMAAIYLGMGYLIVRIFTPALFLGEGVAVLFCSWLLENILLQLEEKASGPDDGTQDDI